MLRQLVCRHRSLVRIRSGSSPLPLPASGRPCPLLCSSLLDSNNNQEDEQYSGYNPTNHVFQIRWKRRDGHSKFLQPRKATKKQKLEYRKRQREIWHEKVGKHSAPNAKASVRRQHDAEFRQDLLDYGKEDETELLGSSSDEYTYGDALLDDLMGNTAELSSTPTPQPVYLGNKHSDYYNIVENQMNRYKQAMATLEAAANGNNKDGMAAVMDMATFPSDHDISMVVRSYRDKHGTKRKPVGAAKVLTHLLKDLGLPVASFGEETFTSILTCCSTPNEARRIFRLMQDHKHPISAYSWSILVDIHSKLGDFTGCDGVLREMVMAGVTPPLAAYTSLLAACHKVCNAGHIPKSVRQKAGELGWNKWKELRIIGLDPDAMAYGAFLRLCAAQGQAERALNVLEEMQTFGVKPTTLCFSSALRAVARSHQIAVRYENGASKHYRKRQQVAAYHGIMTRQVVIAAEAAEVEQDDGFVAALIQCAGAAADSATAKAVLLASEVRKLDHLRTIGSEDHLARLRGEAPPKRDDALTLDATMSQLSLDAGNVSQDILDAALREIAVPGTAFVDSHASENVEYEPESPPSYFQREYGKDSRVLSSLLQACAAAIDRNGLGTIWEGRDNKGYLCENSLNILTVKPEPAYMNNAIPNVSSTNVGLGSLTYEEDDPEYMSKRLRRAKFEGVDVDDSGTTMDDLDPYFYQMFKDDDPVLNRRNPDSVVEQLPLDDPAWDVGPRSNQGAGRPTKMQATYTSQPKEEWFFDIDSRKWKSRTVESVVEDAEDDSLDTSFGDESGFDDYEEADFFEGHSSMYYDAKTGRVQKIQESTSSKIEEPTEEWYFDQNESKWKTRLVQSSRADNTVQPSLTQYEAQVLSQGEQESYISYHNSTTDYQDIESNRRKDPKFEEFVASLRNEVKEEGQNIDFTEEEARQLFAMMNNSDGVDLNESELFGSLDSEIEQLKKKISAIDADDDDADSEWLDGESSLLGQDDKVAMLDDEQRQMMKFAKSMGVGVDVEIEDGLDSADGTSLDWVDEGDYREAIGAVKELQSDSSMVRRASAEGDMLTAHPVENERDYMLEELQTVLPGMPETRLKKVAKAFKENLGFPSLLTLTPLLRENLPERVTTEWLQRKNVQNAYFVIEKAKESGLLDVHMMNGMLQVETSTGSIDRALSCHEARFQENGLTPTGYSDRLVLQMLVNNNRLSRALKFKEHVERSGRKFDPHSYGTLIAHYAKHRQVGSALMMLKECVAVHDSPPSEHSLNALRRLCRHQHLTEKVGLEELAGPDPLEWLRDGEATKKREYSKKGRRQVLLPRNRSVDI